MDIKGVDEIHALLQSLKQEGKTIILASHSIFDIGKACDIVYTIHKGKLELDSEWQAEYISGIVDRGGRNHNTISG